MLKLSGGFLRNLPSPRPLLAPPRSPGPQRMGSQAGGGALGRVPRRPQPTHSSPGILCSQRIPPLSLSRLLPISRRHQIYPKGLCSPAADDPVGAQARMSTEGPSHGRRTPIQAKRPPPPPPPPSRSSARPVFWSKWLAISGGSGQRMPGWGVGSRRDRENSCWPGLPGSRKAFLPETTSG